jgi:hypothetical protein
MIVVEDNQEPVIYIVLRRPAHCQARASGLSTSSHMPSLNGDGIGYLGDFDLAGNDNRS